jgi:hypothetical protein
MAGSEPIFDSSPRRIGFTLPLDVLQMLRIHATMWRQAPSEIVADLIRSNLTEYSIEYDRQARSLDLSTSAK